MMTHEEAPPGILPFGGGPPRPYRQRRYAPRRWHRRGDPSRGPAPGWARHRASATRVAARAAALAALAHVVACVRTTTVSYLPSPEQPRLTLDEGRALLAQFIGVECDRLRGAARAAAETRVRVRLDDAGQATAAELAASTGDGRVDGLLGAVAAQLRLDAPADERLELRAGYRCTDEGSVAVTLERGSAP